MPNNNVDVYVDSEGTVTCVPNTLETGTSWRTFRLYWHMASEGWKITGVTDKKGGPLDPNVFYDGKSNGRGWRIKDKNPHPGTYEYNIYVSNIETGETICHDPAIKNGGRK